MNKNNDNSKESAAVETKVEEFNVLLEEFLVNLKDENKARYLKVSIALGGDLANEELKTEIEASTAQIRDMIITILRSKTTADLANSGEEALKSEIKNSINGIVTKGQLVNVYFTNLIVQ